MGVCPRRRHSCQARSPDRGRPLPADRSRPRSYRSFCPKAEEHRVVRDGRSASRARAKALLYSSFSIHWDTCGSASRRAHSRRVASRIALAMKRAINAMAATAGIAKRGFRTARHSEPAYVEQRWRKASSSREVIGARETIARVLCERLRYDPLQLAGDPGISGSNGAGASRRIAASVSV